MKQNTKPGQQKKKVVAKPVPQKAVEQGFFMKYKEILLLGLVLVITTAIYAPALFHKLTNWDDQYYVTDNLYIKALTAANLEHIFTKPIAVNYHPLTMLSLALNYRVSGLNPASYFLVNIILHLFNILLAYYFATLVLGRNKPMALFVAAIFAVHPMHVESVAWVAERKDVLYTLFFLSGLITWIKFNGKRDWKWYLFAFVLFVFAGLSKPSSVVFPLVLLLLDYLNNRKFTMMLFIEKIPFFLVSVGIGMATLFAQVGKAVGKFDNYSIIQRFLFAMYGFFIYIFKLFFPIGMSTLHPFPVHSHSLALPWIYFAAPVFDLIIIGLVIYSLKYTRVVLFCLLFYFVNIMLTLQFLQVGSAIIAERYTYVSYIGILIALAWLIKHVSDKRKIPVSYFYVIMLVFFGIMTVAGAQRVSVWENSETLWTDVIAKYPDNAEAYNSRGYYFLKDDKYDLALPDLNKSLELNPLDLDALNNRGSILRQQHQPRLALVDYNKALSVNPNYVLAISGRGNAYFSLGILDSALMDFNRALQVDSSFSIAFGNRGAVYFRMGRFDRTIDDCSRAIAIDPFYTEAYLNRGVAYSSTGKWDLAISDYTMVLKTRSDNPSVYEWRGIAYRSKGAFQQAISDFTTGIRLAPRSSSLFVNRSMAYKQAGMQEQATNDENMARQLAAGGAK
ncbi:MAG: tetratricopeptide repeat protein [Bacteroidota bacterium]